MEAGATVGLAAAYFELGRKAEAEIHFRIAEKRSAENAAIYMAFLMRTISGRRADSPVVAHLAQRLRPKGSPANSIAGLERLGELQYANQMHGEAEQSFRHVLEHNPNSANAHDWLAFLKLMNGDAAGALPFAEQAVKLDPTVAQSQCNLGRARLGTGNLTGATSAFREAIRLDAKRDDAKQLLDYALKLDRGLVAPPPREVKK